MRILKVIGALLALLMVIPAGAASAAVWHQDDPRDYGGGRGDLSRVRIDNAPRNLFVRVAFYRSYNYSDWVFLDTRRSDPGPEFVVDVNAWDDYQDPEVGLSRVKRGWWPETSRRCPSLELSTKDGDLRFTVPRRCLGIKGKVPGAVRIAVASEGPDEESPAEHDWAPGVKRFGPWVRHAS